MPVILDAKRGDIGSTAEQYAREVFVRYRADAVTLSPLLGFDSIEPYLRHDGKGVILLCRTSNPGGADLQEQRLDSGERVYERHRPACRRRVERGGQLGLVVGATYPAEIARVREIAPTLPLLIPGIGAQGGDASADRARRLARQRRAHDRRRSSSARRAPCSTQAAAPTTPTPRAPPPRPPATNSPPRKHLKSAAAGPALPLGGRGRGAALSAPTARQSRAAAAIAAAAARAGAAR